MSRPRTRADLESLRAQGSLVGYFAKLPRDLPPKRAKLVDKIDNKQTSENPKPTPGPGRRLAYEPSHLAAAVKASVGGSPMEEFDNVNDNTIAALIPVTTLKRYVKKANELIEKGESVDYGHLCSTSTDTNNRSLVLDLLVLESLSLPT